MRNRNKAGILIVVAASLAALALAVQGRVGQDGDFELSYDELPHPVQAAAEGLLGAPFDYRAQLEIKGKARIYAVEAVRDGRLVSLEFTEWGQWVEVESEVGFEELPPAVQQSLLTHFPGQDFRKIEEVQRHYYEFDVVEQGREREIQIDAFGRLKVVEEEALQEPDSR